MFKYEAKNIKIEAGKPAGTFEETIKVDSSYKKIIGLALYEIENGNLPYYEVGISDNNFTYHHLAHKDDFKPFGVERYKPIAIDNMDQQIKIRYRIPAEVQEDVQFQLVFLLQKD
jgi:hypothetical protein